MSSPAKASNAPSQASGPASGVSKERLRTLGQYSACDVSDALLKLKVPGAGFISDIRHFAPAGITSEKIAILPKIVAPAQTILFVPKRFDPATDIPSSADARSLIPLESNIPPNTHYVDLTRRDAFVVMSQPSGQKCAILGGIMGSRMKVLGARGIVVGGRIRDLRELKTKHIPIWAAGTSTVGAGSESKVWAIDAPISVQGTLVRPGDIIFSDPVEGVVVIPADKLDAVLEIIPRLVRADDKVKQDVDAGVTVKEAFAKWRTNL